MQVTSGSLFGLGSSSDTKQGTGSQGAGSQGAGSGSCFPSTALVQTPSGSKPMQHLSVGDEVLLADSSQQVMFEDTDLYPLGFQHCHIQIPASAHLIVVLIGTA